MTLPEHYVDLGDEIDLSALSAAAQEKLMLAALRIHTAEASLDMASRDYAAAEITYREACIVYAEDPDDNFEDAIEKAERWRIIDKEFKQASDRWGFEIREVAKSGRLIKAK